MNLIPLTIYNLPEQTPLRRMMMFQGLTGGLPLNKYTATGNPLTFDTNVEKPLKSLLIPWTPTQSGTGDPSPTNVRPISGVSGVNVTRCGKNLFDKDAVTHEKYLNSSGVETASPSGYDWCITDYIPVIGNGKITYKNIGATGSAPYSAWYTADKTLISTFKQHGSTTDHTEHTTSVPETAKYVRFSMLNSGTNLNDFIVALGESIGDYVAYTGNTVSVVFPAEPGTVYGGLLSLKTGVLAATHKSVTFTGAESEEWAYDSGRFYNLSLTDAKGVKSARKEVLANIGKYMDSGSAEYCVFLYTTSNDVKQLMYYPPSGMTEPSDFKTWLSEHNLQVVYELARTKALLLTPEQINTLIGTNTIWTDTNGTNEAVYLKKG